MLEVLRPGLQTTVQDLGRQSLALGVPGGGAADPVSLRLANALVGNPPGAAGLEVTLAGPRLQFGAEALVALCGAPFTATLNGQPLPLERAVAVPAGATLDVGAAARGLRAVLALRGGVDVPEVFGSRATDLKGGFGGREGRALRRGDRLGWFPRPEVTPRGAFLSPTLGTPTGPAVTLRVLPTLEATPALLAALTGHMFTVSPQADRMGVRLAEGVPAPHDPTRVSLPNVPGAVQLPPDGRPILLLPDAGTHGGYPTPLVVAAVDRPALGQLRPGDRARFRPVTLEEAHAALRARERALRGVEGALAWWYKEP